MLGLDCYIPDAVVPGFDKPTCNLPKHGACQRHDD